MKYGDETKRSTTVYDGADRTTVIPPAGGTAQTTVTNALGQTTQRLTYTNAERTEYNTTTYGYDLHGKLASLTDPAGNQWTWHFDTRGREIEADDPDEGVTTTSYDDLDLPTDTTDARGITLTTTYDALGRSTQRKQGATLRAKWTYDQAAKGQPDTTTRYVDGAAYTTTINSYNDRYQPTKTTVTLPDSAGALGRSYTFNSYYDPETGQLTRLDEPAIGNLPAERIGHSYTSDGLPDTTTSSTGLALATGTHYDVFSRPERTQFGAGGWKMYDTRTWDEHTGELTSRTIDGEVALRIEGTHYTYDDAGNVTRIQSTSGQDAQAATDNQCFTLDTLQRLTNAWTTTSPDDDCTTAPTTATVGGPDAYWHSYSYDPVGNRKQDTQHPVGATEQVTRTYTYGDTGTPHSLQSVTTQGGPDAGRTETFDYDKAGNTTTRTGGENDQTLTWNPEGHLNTVTENNATTTYIYDADGNRLLSRNADGSTTAYLPGGNEITAVSNTITGTRYYTHGGNTIAARTPHGVKLLFPDQQGTAFIAVAAGLGQAVTRRRQLPFGAPRNGSAATWPTTHGFLGGTSDPTGTTHLGAREYDPQLGRFLSVDPKLIIDDPRQHNPYVYAGNNPVNLSDPTGTHLACGGWGDDTPCPKRPDGSRGNGRPNEGVDYSAPSSSHSATGGSAGGCNRACLDAVDAITQKFKSGLYGAMAKELEKYILALTGNSRPCAAGAMVTSGTMAACADLSGTGSAATWQDLLEKWAYGKGGADVFGAGSTVTQQIAAGPNTLETLMGITKKILASGGDVSAADIGGRSARSNPTTPAQLTKDLLGMATDGKHGTRTPEAFLGSYDQIHQVVNINKRKRQYTVAFAAFNETGIQSLTHLPHAFTDWRQGVNGGNYRQMYYWTMTVSY